MDTIVIIPISIFQIVLDVEAFKSGDISVRALSSNEIIVEGQMNQNVDSKSSKRSFKRCFYLPGPIDMANVTSAVSSDGVLTIIAPKKKSSVQHLDEEGKVSQLQVSNMNKGQGTSWQDEHEESSSGDGFSSHTICKTFRSEYSS